MGKDDLMTRDEVAALFGIDPEAVRSTLRRYGITEVRGYPREAVEEAHRNRPGKGWRAGQRNTTDTTTTDEENPVNDPTPTNDHYEETGIGLAAAIPQEYGPDRAETVYLYRCTICGALVDGYWLGIGKARHTEWHEKLAAARIGG